MNFKNWKKEIFRDLLALGGIPFFLLVIARSFVGGYSTFTYQIVLSLFLISFVGLFFGKFNQHVSRALVLIVFTILFYNQTIYNFFAAFVGILLLFSLIYSKIDKKEIFFGVFLGSIISFISYYLVNLINFA
jgi:hypothetical protein